MGGPSGATPHGNGAGTGFPPGPTIRYIDRVKNEGPVSRQGVLDVQGAHCPSCAFTIEKLGRKVPGVTEVRVDVTRHEIRVDYDGAPGTLESIVGIVARLGYAATVRTS
jgi:Cu2+-exporting ATPase